MRVVGGISWYGGPHDAEDNNVTSTGIPNASVAGVATRYPHTKKGWWFISEPGKPQGGHLLRDIETGPGRATKALREREFDFNPRAAALFGWRPTDAAFPTNKKMEGVYLGQDRHQAAEKARQLKAGGSGRPRRMPVSSTAPSTSRGNGAGNTLGGLPLPLVAQALAAIRQGL